MRLQKYLSRAGVASRRRAEAMIRQGRVRVNGRTVTEMGRTVDPERDRVEADGREVRPTAPVWIALHKPPGYVSTRDDPQGRPTIYDLVPETYRGLFHVGRLDLDSEGLVLLTNEGDAANRMLHPRYGVDRVYRVDVDGRPDDAALERLRAGVELEDGRARAVTVGRLDPPAPGTGRLDVTMREGRKREVRRMFDAIGHPVRRLVRIRYGPVALGSLEPGGWRRLTTDERRAIRSIGPPTS